MNKNIGANRVKIVDNSGNEGSNSWSRSKAVDVSTTDFEPGFNFEIFIGTAGTIVVLPADNDSSNPQINELERAFYKGDVTMEVPIGKMPGLYSAIRTSGTDAGDIIVGR